MSESSGVIDNDPLSIVALVIGTFLLLWFVGYGGFFQFAYGSNLPNTCTTNGTPQNCFAQMFDNTKFFLYILIPMLPFMMMDYWSNEHSILRQEQLLRPRFGFSFSQFGSEIARLGSTGPSRRNFIETQRMARSEPDIQQSPQRLLPSTPVGKTIDLPTSSYRVISSEPQ